MKQVAITQNYFVLVDDEDFEKISKYKWYIHKTNKINYARCKDDKTFQYIHRMIIKPEKGEYIDHKNMNGLDNRKENLRICTKSQNGCHRGKDNDNASGYKGVSYVTNKQKRRKRWIAQITINKKHIYIGHFYTAKRAAIAWNLAAKKYHKQFAYQNKI